MISHLSHFSEGVQSSNARELNRYRDRDRDREIRFREMISRFQHFSERRIERIKGVSNARYLNRLDSKEMISHLSHFSESRI
jgi:hypothetical protein